MNALPRIRRYRTLHDQLVDPRWPERAWTLQWFGFTLAVGPRADAESRTARRRLRAGLLAGAFIATALFGLA